MVKYHHIPAVATPHKGIKVLRAKMNIMHGSNERLELVETEHCRQETLTLIPSFAAQAFGRTRGSVGRREENES